MKKNYIVTKKKKNNAQYIIKDGFIKYNVAIIPKITCQCFQQNNKYTYCEHINHILDNYYKLSKFTIYYLYLIYDEFIDIFLSGNKSELNKELEELLEKYFENEDCGICLMPLNHIKYNYHLFRCDKCNKFTHDKCLTRWLQTDKHINKNCIYCRVGVV